MYSRFLRFVIFTFLFSLVALLTACGQAQEIPSTPIAKNPPAIMADAPLRSNITLPAFTATSLPPTATPRPTATPTPLPPTVTPRPTATATPLPPTPTPDPVASRLIVPPPDLKDNMRWIDFNRRDSTTRLMEGKKIVRELPSAFGYGVPGGPDDFYSTAPGIYRVHSKQESMHHDLDYSNLWFVGWVGFDPERANGFHSYLLDETGKVVDDRHGPVSHGCVRTGDWKSVFDFAELGMPVVVHD